MQFLPSTWAECCTGDIENPRDAIIGAGVYLQRSGAPGDMDQAILRYNRDTRYRDAIKAYAANMAADERAYLGYHEWEVFYASSAGSVPPAGRLRGADAGAGHRSVNHRRPPRLTATPTRFSFE